LPMKHQGHTTSETTSACTETGAEEEAISNLRFRSG
jgi:hypothetical protein